MIINILMTIIALPVFAYIAVAMYYSNFDEYRNNANSDKKDDTVFTQTQICPTCKTGKYTYELDPKADMCPYISSLENGKCQFYQPL